jgi:hypothetical protein
MGNVAIVILENILRATDLSRIVISRISSWILSIDLAGHNEEQMRNIKRTCPAIYICDLVSYEVLEM